MLEDVEDLVESFSAAEVAMVPVGRRREGVVVGAGGRWRLGRTRGRGCSVLHGALGHRHRGCAAPAAWALYAAYDTLGYHRTASHLVPLFAKSSRASDAFKIQLLPRCELNEVDSSVNFRR